MGGTQFTMVWCVMKVLSILLGDPILDLPPLSNREDSVQPKDVVHLSGPTKDKEEDTALVPVAEGIQPVPRKIAKKVDSKEFVDFADLLQDQFATEDLSIPATQSGLVLVQSIESLRKKKKRITDFHAWVEALLVFVAIKYREANPEVASLMAYGVVMSQTAREHAVDRWLMYDRKFRESAGANKEVKWNSLNSNLWNRCFSGQPKSTGLKTCSTCTATGHTAWECPSRSYRKPPSRKRLVPVSQTGDNHLLCYPYNNKGECDRGNDCTFIHKCIGCGEDHPQISCRVKRRPA